uniref:Uncharacterized protein n=1 Tax=Rhizophora mucronata TaxID=61149 RepID=A0A2P2MZV6_RHIMU
MSTFKEDYVGAFKVDFKLFFLDIDGTKSNWVKSVLDKFSVISKTFKVG